MKSMFGFLPFSHQDSKYKIDHQHRLLHQSSCPTPGCDSNMKEINSSRETKSASWRMPPLLRLNSEGEISSGKSFCDRVNQSSAIDHLNKQIRLSNSLESKDLVECATQLTYNHIPLHQSFNSKSLEPDIHTISQTNSAHQSHPLSSTTAVKSGFCCAVTNRLCPYSPSPRILGCEDIFGSSSASSSSSDSTSCQVLMQTNSTNMNENKPVDDPQLSLESLQEHFHIKKCSISSSSNNRKKMESGLKKINISCSLEICRPLEMTTEEACVGNVNTEDSCVSHKVVMGKTNCDKDNDKQTASKKKKRRSRGKRKKRKGNNVVFEPPISSSPVVVESENCQCPRLSLRATSNKRRNVDNTNTYLSSACPSSTSSSSTITNGGIFEVDLVRASVCDRNSNQKTSTDSLCKTSTSPHTTASHSVSFTNLSDDSMDFEFEEQTDNDSTYIVIQQHSCSPASPKASSSSTRKACNWRKKKESSVELSDESDDDEVESKAPSSSNVFHLMVGVSLSEDEEEDSVDWGDSCASPCSSDQFVFEFGFNSGLSLDSLVGKTPSEPVSQELKEVNEKWNQCYAHRSAQKSTKPESQRKVSFACEESLSTVHEVGGEDRKGEWQQFAVERAHFKTRVEDVGRSISAILCPDHRQRMFTRLQLPDSN